MLAICASAQYVLRAVAQGVPVKSWVSVAGWYHDPVSVAPFYGGDAGVECGSSVPGRQSPATFAPARSRWCRLTKTATIGQACTSALDYYGRRR